MKNTFITIIPISGASFKKNHFEAADGCNVKSSGREVLFPITAVIEQVQNEDKNEGLDIESKVIAVRFKTANSDNNLELLKQEIAEIGVSKVEVVDIPIEENQDYQTGVNIFMRVLNEIEEDTDVYACVTFGTKIMSLMISYLLDSLAYLRKNVVVQGVYYMEVPRINDKPLGTHYLYDVTNLLYLNNLVKSVSDLHVDDPQEFLQRLVDFDA